MGIEDQTVTLESISRDSITSSTIAAGSISASDLVLDSDRTHVHEFLFADGQTSEEGEGEKKLIWKDILREGPFAMTPTGGGASSKGFSVTVDGESSWPERRISMTDLVNSFNDKAFEHVTVPTSHEDKLLDNTGFAQKLRIVKRNGIHYLQSALGFTEPDIAGKVRRGTIPNVSSGILFGFRRKADGKTFRAAIKHVCLTHTPWVNNLKSFPAVFASDDEIEGKTEVHIYQFADGENTDNLSSSSTSEGSTNTAEIVWNEEDGFSWLRDRVEAALNPQPAPDTPVPAIAEPKPWYSVRDVAAGKALVTQFFKSQQERFIVPFKVNNGQVEIAPSIRWVAAREAMIAASDNTALAVSAVKDKLGEALKVSLGNHARGFKVDDVTLDQRAQIRSAVDGSVWLAEFAVTADGAVLAPVSNWKKIEAAAPKETPQAKPSPAPKTVKLADSLEARLAAARRNRSMLLQSR